MKDIISAVSDLLSPPLIGITDEKGHVHLCEARGLGGLEADHAIGTVSVRFMMNDAKNGVWSTDPFSPRKVQRRDCGIIPLYYFISG